MQSLPVKHGQGFSKTSTLDNNFTSWNLQTIAILKAYGSILATLATIITAQLIKIQLQGVHVSIYNVKWLKENLNGLQIEITT